MPLDAIAGIFAKETGYGFAFTVARDPAASLAAATAPPELDIGPALERDQRAAETPKTAASGSRGRRICRSSSRESARRARCCAARSVHGQSPANANACGNTAATPRVVVYRLNTAEVLRRLSLRRRRRE